MFKTILIIRIFLDLIALAFLYRGFSGYINKKHNHSLFKLLSTTVIWGGVILFASLPNFASKVSQRLGLGENLNVMIFFGFVVVLVICFRLLYSIERLERSISDIVRREALRNISKKGKNNN